LKKILFLIYFLGKIFIFIKGQNDACSKKANATSYEDCKLYNNSATETICCFLDGVYGKNNGTACVPVDLLFTNRTVTYSVGDLSGTLYCTGNTEVNKSKYIMMKTTFYILLLVIFSIL
jgi:hypothetical protein